RMKIFIYAAAMNVVGDIIFVYLYGYVAAAFVTLFVLIFMFVASLFELKKHLKLETKSYIFKILGLNIVFIVIVTLLKHTLDMQYVLEAILITITSFGLYVGAGIYLKLIDIGKIMTMSKAALGRKGSKQD
ncbi:polysaccharide biosynthesis C-terminal domain-containing protein, partial [Patescibacteria group bacterium]|nr:polysaccharide biosynthesis C-terminal domain-containing protein [Patescibacteria group bacterium]